MADGYAGRHVVVTGGTGALGRVVVQALLDAGAHVHVPALTGTASDIGAAGDKLTVVSGVDLASPAAVEGFYAGLPELWASLHIAGGFAMGKLADLAPEAMQAQFTLNAMTCFLCCKAAAARMTGGGRIVNVASRPALEPRAGAGMVAYTVAKAAVAAMTVALAEELVGSGILVNAVAPSTIDTPANRAAMPKADPARWVSPETLAAAMLFLASPANTATRGSVLTVYGRA